MKPIAEVRKAICDACPLNVNGTCSRRKFGYAVKDFTYREGDDRKKDEIYYGCGCVLAAKQKNPDSKCPLGKF